MRKNHNMKILDTDLAWAAGFWEADGSTSISQRSFRLTASQSGYECPPQLIRFAAIMDQNVLGPYKPYALSKKPTWQVCVTGGKAKWAVKLLTPYITEGSEKLEKAYKDMEKADAQAPVKVTLP